MSRGHGRRDQTAHHQREGAHIRVGPYVAPAPREPEYREEHVSPLPNVSVEEMVRQLAADPEFIAWREDEARGRLY